MLWTVLPNEEAFAPHCTDFRSGIRSGKSLGIDAPYGKGGAAERAVSIIESWQPRTTNKKFFDISSDFVEAREASR